MRDFTLKKYRELLDALSGAGYRFYVFEDICKEKISEPYVVLRHDVDRKPGHALRMAELENRSGIKATYYFRIVKKVFDIDVIKKIASMGHEIGYHFEDLSRAGGDIQAAVESFKNNVKKMREIVPVNTVSMHGKPLSRYDNRDLIPLIDFNSLNILCEPYSAVEKLGLVYLTDTGRRWDNEKVNVRDRVLSEPQVRVKRTGDIIEALSNELKGRNMMLNIHPERWDDRLLPWFSGAVIQKGKNAVKYFLIRTGYGK
jgi:hypothetical protein